MVTRDNEGALEMSSEEGFDNLPRRLFLDSCTVQTIGQYGPYIGRASLDTLAPRAKALLDHTAPSVREFAAETIREIEVFEQSNDSYGHVFFLLQRV